MINHYIPRLLLKHFSVQDKVNVCDVATLKFSTRKVRNIFAEQDLFDENLERLFATKLEGPFGDLLNHKLLQGDTIYLERKENLLVRKFILVNMLRSPFINGSMEEAIKRTKLQDHPSVQGMEFLKRYFLGTEKFLKQMEPTKERYIENLRKVMEIGSLEAISGTVPEMLSELYPGFPTGKEISVPMWVSARNVLAGAIAFGDCTESGQEFILPKMQGIQADDPMGICYKSFVIRRLRKKAERDRAGGNLLCELRWLEHASMEFPANYQIYPISPTRALVCISPYFRAYFSLRNPAYEGGGRKPLLFEQQFRQHIWPPFRMSLFEPCFSYWNQAYSYQVRRLTAEETCFLNSIFLDIEPEEFVFRDFNRIRDSFWYYDHKMVFQNQKRHDYRTYE